MPSSVIADFEYDADRSQLTVTFVSGRTYIYFLVPADCVVRFDAAESKGGFFNKYIRDKYPCRDVTPRDIADDSGPGASKKLMPER